MTGGDDVMDSAISMKENVTDASRLNLICSISSRLDCLEATIKNVDEFACNSSFKTHNM